MDLGESLLEREVMFDRGSTLVIRSGLFLDGQFRFRTERSIDTRHQTGLIF